MKKLKSFFVLAAIFVLVGNFYAFNSKETSKAEFLAGNKPMDIEMPEMAKILKKIKVQDVLFERINAKKELVVLETELREEIKWDESFTDWKIFRKDQTIVFYGKAKFSTNLGEITEEMMEYNEDTEVLTIKIKKPIISSVEILEGRTEIYSTNNGLLRFGEIEITAAEQNELMKKVKNSIILELSKDNLQNQAKESATKAVKELLGMFLKNIEVHGVDINVVIE
ncbi:MAG: DUF4230 domain-containing protein [Clostridiales bacterium]|nr:DUF4230 domain-containing protein [Clostridiales bacterium]